ncbi:nitroreductase [Actinomycetes bacterium KLBMP 9759]
MNEIPAALGLDAEQVADLLATAGRAPSLHNSQPWRFRVTSEVIELHADPGRRLPAADPAGREQRLACGAALFNLRLALHGKGIRPRVVELPDAARPDFLAAVGNGGRNSATPRQLDLLAAVPRRRTNRRPFTADAVSGPELHALRRAALEEGTTLDVVSDPESRRVLRRLLSEAHREQDADPAFRAEVALWTTSDPSRVDGVPTTAGGPAPITQDKWLLRDFGAATDAERPTAMFEDEPTIVVLTATTPGPAGELRTGQALQRLLLTATVEGLSASFLSQVVEVERTREQLRLLLGSTRPPQAVLRLGRGWPITSTPRRPVADTVAPADQVPAR